MADSRTDVAASLFVLPPDAKVVPVTELSARLRAAIGPVEPGQSVLTRPGFRVTARLVPGPLAALLTEFRTPSLLTDGILRFARAHGQDPFATLDLAFDALVSLVEARLLVPEASPDTVAPTPGFGAGQAFAGFEIERLVRSLEDSEVYRARGSDGSFVALKISRDDRPDGVPRIANEVRVLGRLEGADTPRLVDAGTVGDRSYIAMEWCDGVSIAAAAQRIRAARDRSRLRGLVGRVFDAYGRLHQHGVLHGDIHPGNCLVSEAGRVVIVDFGNARSIDPGADVDPWRTGIPHFHDPQMAAAALAGRLPPAATPLSEQYSLAAMAYVLLTGVHPIVVPAVHDELLRRIVTRPMLPFSARGIPAWPDVEAVIGKGLANQPGDRFPDVVALARAFAAAGLPPNGPPRWHDAAQSTLDAAIEDVRSVAPEADSFRTAWFALRAAVVLEDAELLAAADILVRRAGSGWAAQSLAALVAQARSDSRSEEKAILGFLSAVNELQEGSEVCAAILAATSMLEGALSRSSTTAVLADWASRQLDQLTDASFSEHRAEVPEPVLVHLALSLAKTGVVAVRSDLQGRLEAARDDAVDNPWLWALAHDVFADARFAARAKAAKLSNQPLLRGFALLRLHQLDGDMSWISKAHRVVAKAPNVRLPALDTALLMVELTAPEQAILPPFAVPFGTISYTTRSRSSRPHHFRPSPSDCSLFSR